MFQIFHLWDYEEELARKAVASVREAKEVRRKLQHRIAGHQVYEKREWIRILDGRISDS